MEHQGKGDEANQSLIEREKKLFCGPERGSLVDVQG